MSDSDELELSHKSWKRSMDPVEKDGFREGFEKGREAKYQEGFNLGFKSGFQFAFQKAQEIGKTRLKNESFKDALDGVTGSEQCSMCSLSEEELDKMNFQEIVESLQTAS